MKFVLLFTAIVSTNDGAAVTKLSQEFDSKTACASAIQADSGQKVDFMAEYPSALLPIAAFTPPQP